MVFNMVSTAHEYNMTPSEFFALSSQDKALMMTYSNVVAKMKSATSNSQKKDFK